MESQTWIVNWLRQLTLWGVVKWFVVVGTVMYTLFALIIVRQAGAMSETIEAIHNKEVKLFAWMHLILAVLLVVVSLVILN